MQEPRARLIVSVTYKHGLYEMVLNGHPMGFPIPPTHTLEG
jgi:hypothetical protein